MVVISLPSACTASTLQDFTLRPSSSTVHAPQLEVSQPIGVPTRPSLVAQPVHEQQPGFDLVLPLNAVHIDADPSHTSATTDPRVIAAASG